MYLENFILAQNGIFFPVILHKKVSLSKRAEEEHPTAQHPQQDCPFSKVWCRYSQ